MIILTSVLYFVWFAVGFLAGYLNGKKQDVKEFVDETGKTIRIEMKKLTNPHISGGRIKPVTAQEVYKRSLNTERREALEETRKTLDAIPDLVKARELAEQMRKESYGKH